MSARILRPYQQRFCAQITTLWQRGVDRVIGVLPTGGGKTECAAELSMPFQNVLSICHTRVLAEQLQARLSKAATWQGLRQRQQRGEGWPYGTPDLLVVDEVHVGDSPDWQHVFEMVHEGTKVLGLTATPWRFSHGCQQKGQTKVGDLEVGGRKNARYGKGLGDLFEAMIVGVTPRELVRNGYLVPLRVMNVVEAQDAAASLAGLRGPSWDVKRQKHVGRVTGNHDARLCPVDAWLKFGENRKTMVFCHLVAAAERTALKFQALGVKAAVVHGKLKEDEAARRLQAFKDNELQVLVNVMQLTCGVDVPDVRCLIIDRGANNLNTYIQMCGRGARLADGKTDCLILDLTGCSSVHGDPQKDQDYWVVTSEGRPVSDLACEVCGTRLSPMFPQRCMRCDPFRPKLGDPKELLDTGMRVYCALKDLREQDGWGELSPDQQDTRISDAMIAFEPSTDLERQIAQGENAAAANRIRQRQEALEATRMAEERERLRMLAEQERAARQAAWQAENAQREQARKERFAAEQAERAKLFADKERAKLEAQKANEWTPEDRDSAMLQLEHKFRLYMQRGWTLSSATRDVRQSLPRYASKYSRENYAVPDCLKPLLIELNASWSQRKGFSGNTPAQYELDRMLGDNRTARYGEAWCRKKVVELFGRDCWQVQDAPKRLQLEMQAPDSGTFGADRLDDIPF